MARKIVSIEITEDQRKELTVMSRSLKLENRYVSVQRLYCSAMKAGRWITLSKRQKLAERLLTSGDNAFLSSVWMD